MRQLTWIGLSLCPLLAHTANPDGPLRIEVTTAYNFIVDSNVETPATYAPRAAFISARIWNDGSQPLTDVVANIGDFSEGTPGIYPSRVHTENTDITGPLPGGAFALTHEGGSMGLADATRTFSEIPAGGYVPVYWLVSYPNLDVDEKSVTGGRKPDDDLYLFYDIWVRADDGAVQREADVNRRANMRRCLSAMANKIFPNTANKVPQEYQDLLERFQPEWNNIEADGSPGTSVITEGIWYDLGNVNKGFDNDGDLVPDQNAWLQPVGDPSLFDSGAFRLVNTYALIVVKLKGGGELVLDVQDQLYFTNLPDNTGVIGLVRYDFMPLQGPGSAVLTPYQMAASGFDNEKFNGDYGVSVGVLESNETEVVLEKSVNLQNADPGATLLYTVDFSNDGSQPVGEPNNGLPLVVHDSIPPNTTYVAGTAAAGNILPAGVSSYQVRYSTDNGATWVTTEPAPASGVTDLQWWLSDPLDPDAGGSVTFSVVIDSPLTGVPVIQNIAGLSFGNALPFLTDDAITLINGSLSISGTVFEDDGEGGGGYANGVQDGAEAGIDSVSVSLFAIVNGQPVFLETVQTDAQGNYLFENLPDGDYQVVVDAQDTDIPEGYAPTTATTINVALSGGDSTGNDFGFAPTLVVEKTGTEIVREGGDVTYDITVSNNYPNVVENVVVSGFANALDTNYTLTQSSRTWLNRDNIEGNTPSSFTSATFPNPTKAIGVRNFGIPSGSPATINNVVLELVGAYRQNQFEAQDTLDVRLYNNVSGTLLQAFSVSSATLQALPTTSAGATVISINVTSAKSPWAWSDFGNPSNLSVQLETNRGGNQATAGTLFLSGVRFSLTTNDTVSPNTLSLVPLTDTYNADELTFVSANPAPDSTSVIGSVGTLTWNNIGPIAPESSSSVTVNFTANELAGPSITTTNIASVNGAQFLDGSPANSGSDTADTLIYPAGAIGDTIFFDVNRNGVQDTNEPGIPGVVVDLYRDNLFFATTTTDANGFYVFQDLDPGNYEVRVDETSLPAGSFISADPDNDGLPCSDPLAVGCDGRYAITLAQGQTFMGADFGYFIPGGVIAGTLWVDFDDDGLVGEEEPRIPFILVELYELGNPDPIATTFTDENGEYAFGGLDDGTYSVVVVTDDPDFPFPANYEQTVDPDGTLDDVAEEVVISSGNISTIGGTAWTADNEEVNFGYRFFGTNSFSGTIGLDGDPEDGLLNGLNPTGVAADEVAFANVSVFIYAWEGDDPADGLGTGVLTLLGSTVTNTNGDYSFTNLPDTDFYIVSMVPPIGNLVITSVPGVNDHPADGRSITSNSQGHTTGAFMWVAADDEITNMDFAFRSVVEYDFGDLPEAYASITLLPNGARHIVPDPDNPTLYLGEDVNTEPNGQPSPNADADDFDDGVFVTGIWSEGSNGGSVRVDVVGTGWLVGFIDFNIDGDFIDAGELVLSQAVTTGTYTFSFDVPAGTLVPEDLPLDSTFLFSRFRILPTEPLIPELAFSGEASNGEVEDYRWGFHVVTGTVYRDAENDGEFTSNNVVVPGVVVELYDGDDNLLASTVTQLDGSYTFIGIPPGNYEVRSQTPADFTAVLDVDGSDNGDDLIELSVVEESFDDQDFLINNAETLSAVSGTVWVDTNTDGEFSGFPGDTPSEGTEVRLYRDLNGDGVADPNEFVGSTTTDQDGEYEFTGLPDGDYIVVVVPPSGTTPILDADGSANGDDLIEFTLAGQDVDGRDFLLAQNMSIFGTITIDTTGNLEGNIPHGGVTVQLLDEDDNVLATTFSCSDFGCFLFPITQPGNYKVRQLVPTGFVAVNDEDGGDLTVIGDVTLITVNLGNNITGIDFVNQALGSISGTILLDTTGNGTGDTPQQGVLVTLLDGDGEEILDGDNNPITVTTDENGFYSFTNVPPGDYQVRQTVPTGFIAIDDVDGGNLTVNGDEEVITIELGTDVTGQDFVNTQLGAISGTIRLDTTGDNAGNIPHAEIQVELFDEANNSLGTTDTDSNGFYVFENLPPGEYRVVQSVPAGFVAVNDVDGGDLTQIGDVDLITVLPGQTTAEQDFVNAEFGSISGTIFIDTTGNNVGDIPHEGVTVELLDLEGDPVLDGSNNPITTVTDENGFYEFTNLPTGFYKVAQTVPSGFHAVDDVDGGDLTINGDITAIDVLPGSQVEDQDFVNTQLGIVEDIDFCLSLDNGDSLIGSFVRLADLPPNVTWYLEYASALADPVQWQGAIALDGSNTSVMGNSNGTETVTIPDIRGLTGLIGDSGFVRIRMETDTSGDEVADEVVLSEVSGWVISDFETNQCRSYNNPFLECSPLTAEITFVDEVSPEVVLSRNAEVLESGVAYYLEITNGDFEGHRFDVVSAENNVLTLAEASSLCGLDGPFNTLTGPLPAGLEGATSSLYRHKTLDSLFPVDVMQEGVSPSDADQITVWNGTTFECYFLYEDGANTRWALTSDPNLVDQGGRVIPPGHAVFVNSKSQKVLISYGQVRQNAFRRPLCAGKNLVGAGYPITQSALEREMTLDNGFTGHPDYVKADQFWIWNGDSTLTGRTYTTYYLDDWFTPERWIRSADVFRVDVKASPLFVRDRGAVYMLKNDNISYFLPSPWTP
ncbi:MAG: DUF11 domain-containing protein [Verrucomicrobia bacterium]|nr:DUF11 domain-containing protein [Verrucomicrobiota bacterium]MCH8512287.1 GEVED domain-containing protein [Kiritimatiellia bacterium]